MPDVSGYIGGIASSFLGWAKSGLFWTVGGFIILVIVIYFYAYMKRRGKLRYNALELVRFGNGKVGMNIHKAGIFKRKTAFFGLWDYGEENVFKVDDGREIQGARTSFLHDVFGKKGFVLVRKSDDSKILVPIHRIDFNNLKALLEIAPADYREASVKLFREAQKETQSTWEKIMPYIAIGIIVILCIITIIINQQMTNNTIDKVGTILIQGCQNAQAVAPSGSP